MLVDLDDATARYGGSWQGYADDLLQAYDQGAIWDFWTHVQALAEPVVLDVGANTGSFCLLAKFHPGMRVWAFEPNYEVRQVLEHNVALNELETRVKVLPYAALDYVGSALLTVPNDDTLSGLSFIDIRPANHICTVKEVMVLTLDVVTCSEGITHVDAIKIDVEGREEAVLRGGAEMIRRDHPFLFTEATNVQKQRSLLESWGYTVNAGPHDIQSVYEAKGNYYG
jgi:FkbM family methyltransferase